MGEIDIGVGDRVRDYPACVSMLDGSAPDLMPRIDMRIAGGAISHEQLQVSVGGRVPECRACLSHAPGRGLTRDGPGVASDCE